MPILPRSQCDWQQGHWQQGHWQQGHWQQVIRGIACLPPAIDPV